MTPTTVPEPIPQLPAEWPKLSDQDWVALHVPRFEKVRGRYEEYQHFLEAVFKAACRKLAPVAVVETRTKSIVSFAEKILRKRKLYQDPKDPQPPDPLVRMTDLCGGRIVVQTAEEVRAVCQFIEAAFDIDWPNSEDVSQRLKPTEFGYRSVHYIVQPNPAKLKTLGIQTEVPASLLGIAPEDLEPHAAGCPLKAEVQVRTLLEHAAASLGHDTIYKTELKVPDQIKRHHATLAAMLENVDAGFGQLLASLKEFQSSFGTYHEREAVVEEIARLRIVLGHDPKNIELAVRIAQLALSVGDYKTTETVLEFCRKESHFGVERTLGQALMELHWDQPRSAEYLQGIALLEAARTHPPKDAETLCLLAEGVAREDDQRACELFHEAIQVDATEPVALSRYLEFEIFHLRNDDAIRLATPMIHSAMVRCRKQIAGRVNLPAAWSSLGVFHLLLGEPFGALEAVAQLTCLCHGKPAALDTAPLSGRPCAVGRHLLRLRETLRRLHSIQEKLPGYDWLERLVMLALAVRVHEPEARDQVRKLASWHRTQSDPLFQAKDLILILSGGCAPAVQPFMDELRPHLLRGLEGMSISVISGGTNMGISGLAGDLSTQPGEHARAIGYLPARLPLGLHEDSERFAKLVTSNGTDFTPLDPMQGWIDLLSGNVDPARVRVLAHAVGTISRAECAISLALGARVAIIENVRLRKERQFLDPAWQNHPRLTRLPMDAMSFRAFVLCEDRPLTKEEKLRLEKAARRAHEDYVASATPRDPALSKWDKLDPALQDSNYSQIAYWEQMLKEHGLGVRQLTEADRAHEPLKMEDVLSGEDIRRLAEMEHGRWNVERLTRGWHWADTKDIAKKLNPCLVPWPDLKNINGDDYQPYDTDAVRGLPKKLREVELELYKL